MTTLNPEPQTLNPALAARCAAIELLVLDVDGVLSDGSILVDDAGVETKRFHVRDGAGIAYWKRLGKRVAIISGRRCAAVDHRAAEMGIARVYQGRLDKLPALRELLALEGLQIEQACVVGDDLADIPPMQAAGLAVAVADASPEVREAAHHVTDLPGGRGAVREVIELVLRAQGRWAEIVSQYQRVSPC
jgi:3-deoxy-D-manno-octulosonate 8-phosphate phosphatase (KDO 8-P phosphatase)